MPKFEESLKRLEEIVAQMEQGEIPLEQALKLFEEGVKLTGSCRQELDQAEGKIEILLKKDGKLQSEPFEASAEKAATPRR